MNRWRCLTEKIKSGNMAPVYMHYDVDDGGTIVRKQISVPGKNSHTDFGTLLDTLAKRINAETIEETVDPL